VISPGVHKDAVEDFALRLTGMVTTLLGEPVGEDNTVCKFLRRIPEKYDQIAISIETCFEMEAPTIEDVNGRLKAAEDRFAARVAKDLPLPPEPSCSSPPRRSGR
jgi:hypothetical protein